MTRSQQRSDCSNQGFTLIEALVAFSILSLAVVLGLQVFASGTSQIQRVSAKLRAFRTAETELALARSIEAHSVDGTIRISPLPPESVDWSTTAPYIVRFYNPDEREEVLETIFIRDAEPP